ncbi:hypothetical protein NE237_019955 [Protea cynaroides]|uniref:Uncharacterized protein n=1 Tax=Protea cynaroides TaxID=273540 RepID=A0A9Q0H6A7_9MAGN|nr:hypothetical protein NE237_019955 [Protea cynaroides]
MVSENSMGCLGNLMSSSHQNFKLLVAREGGIECLKNYWKAAPSVWHFEDEVRLLTNKASSRFITEAFISRSTVGEVLSFEVSKVKSAVASTVYKLGSCTKMRKELDEAPVVQSNKCQHKRHNIVVVIVRDSEPRGQISQSLKLAGGWTKMPYITKLFQKPEVVA